ncbi:MAG: c-type cytochrome domain-containing protein [Phycisphaerales bacterium]
MRVTLATSIGIGTAALACGAALRGDTITYVDHVRPIFVARCLNCHNPDKLKGDLDLSTYRTTLAGSSSGAIVVAGDPNASILVGVLERTREPPMPPRSDKLPASDLATIRAWVAGGCLETSDSRPQATAPTVKLASAEQAPLAAATRMRMPIATLPPTAHGCAALAIAAHPASPVVALAGERQVLLYELDRRMLVGALPTANDAIHALGFTRDGRTLIAAGGVEGASGAVRLWSVPEGRPIATVGAETDVVLAADLDVRRERVAIGGPSRTVKVLAVADGTLIQRLTKHTDWITAVSYSPDGVLLATADRAGGVLVWEAASLAPYQALAGHAGRVSGLDWSADSNMLASTSEDGRVRLWDMNDGHLVKEWVAHPTGAMSIRVTRDGKLLTAGRDRVAKLWDSSGGLVREFPPMGGLALCAVIDAAGGRVVAADLSGAVTVWSAADGAALGALDANPIVLDVRLAQAQSNAEKAMALKAEREQASLAAKNVLTKAEADAAAATKELADAQSAADAAQAALVAAQGDEAKAKQALESILAAASAAAQAETQANAVVEQALAALKGEVERDAAAQAVLTASRNEHATLATAAEDAARAAAANDDPAKHAAADAAQAQAKTAAEKLASAQTLASESSAKVRTALEASERAKTEATNANAARASRAREATAATDALGAASARSKAAEGSAASARSAVEAKRVVVTARGAALEQARTSATQAQGQLDAAVESGRVALAEVARCRAGGVRQELDAGRAELAARELEAKPAVDVAAASASAATKAESEWTSAQASLVNMPERIAALTGELAKARETAVSAQRAAEAAAAAMTERATDRATLAAAAERMAKSSQAAPGDAALAAASAKCAEALAQLDASLASAKSVADAATAALSAAQRSAVAAQQALAAAESDQATLPKRIEELGQHCAEAKARADADRAAADRALEPARAVRERVAEIEKRYDELLAIEAQG